jgi:hypothetical protein
MGSDPYQAMLTAGLEALRSGRHDVEGDPRSTGRWGPSVVLRPSGDVARCLADLTTAAAACLDGAHWLSGDVRRAHLTVRALEPYAESIETDRLARYRSALVRATRRLGPLTFEFTGVGISTGSVLVRAFPVGPAADQLREQVGAELGPDGWLEDSHFANGRDPIWYCSIIHYAGRLENVEPLIDWVADRDGIPFGAHTFTSVDVCSWSHDGAGMAPQVEASVHLPGGG